MCGVVGMIAKSPVNQLLFDALTVLQHRGQDAAGIATYEQGQLFVHKDNGLVREVFRTRHMMTLKGNAGIGHVRYPTAGTTHHLEAQPFYVNSPYGMVLAHNGNLINADTLRAQLVSQELRHLNTHSDSEVILNVLAHELQKLNHHQAQPKDFFKAVAQVHARIRGGYAVVVLIAGHGLLAFRDPFGIRPLILGQRDTELGPEAMVASESVALTSAGFRELSDCAPGEAIFIDLEARVFREQCAKKTQLSPCLFEYVYFARPDSIMDKISVYKLRRSIGKRLGQKILKEWGSDFKIDAVIPVPETSRHAALPLALELNCKLSEGFVKNRYIGRTFIMPGQETRARSVRQKLNTISLEFQDKHVLLVDDSIVRGTTSQEIIQMAREAGAQKVFLASAAPPVKFPNIYGIDIPSKKELIASCRSLEEIAAFIGADKLIYLDLEDLIAAAKEGNPNIRQFDTSVFDGHYITGDESAYLKQMENRGDLAFSIE